MKDAAAAPAMTGHGYGNRQNAASAFAHVFAQILDPTDTVEVSTRAPIARVSWSSAGQTPSFPRFDATA